MDFELCAGGAGDLLPTFSTPAPVIDCIDVSSASGAEIDLFASLEGIVNRSQPRINCASTADREGKFTWLKLHHLPHHRINGYTAILKYRTNVTGLVVPDPDQPDTLNLATTIAGVKNELICDPSLVAALTNAPYNLPVIDDLRGLFSNRYQVYNYLYSNYWSQCTHRLMAGMEPGLHGELRDYLVATKTATVWLNPGPLDFADKTVLAQFLSGMTAVDGVYLGWWPDEAKGLNWIAQYGIPVLASDFLRNASLYSGVAHVIHVPDIPSPPPLQNKVYVSLILSDGDNIQYMQHVMKLRWSDAARGSIPIGWTVSPLAADVDPTMLDYYWSTATKNDCLISGPSGAGYTHMENWNAANGSAYARVTKDWHDTWRFQTGVEYKVLPGLDLRAGYIYDEEAINSQYADYLLPSNNRHYFSLGPGFHWDKWSLDLSYTYVLIEDRDVTHSLSTGYANPSYLRDGTAT